MRTIYLQFSGLIGLFAFLTQLWNYAPLERTVVVGAGVFAIVYVVLLVADVVIHRILAQAETAATEEAVRPDASTDAAKRTVGAKGESKDKPNVAAA